MTRRQYTPRPCNVPAIDWMLHNPRCAVHSGMGTGKTASTLVALDILLLAGEVNKVLVLGPLRVARNTWTDEAAKWEQLKGLRFSRVMGTEAERIAGLKADADIYLTNYEQLAWLVGYLGASWNFDTVVADEAVKLKNYRTRQGGVRTRALAKVAFRKVTRFIELSGAPTPNGLADLWGQMWFLDAGIRLGSSYSAYMDRWFQKQYDGHSFKPAPHAFDEITEAANDLCLSIRAQDYFDIQDPIVTDLAITLDPKSKALYTAMEKQMYLEIEEMGVEAFNAASKTIKCLQIANGTIYTDAKQSFAAIHDHKLDALESIVEEANGMPVLVAYSFKSDLARLLARFKGSVDLATPEGMRKFKSGTVRVGIGHPASVGHGIDGLQDVTNIIAFFGMDWNFDNRAQMIERIGPVRQMQSGHNRLVYVYNLIAEDTLDRTVLEALAGKKTTQDALLERMRGNHHENIS